MRRHHVLLSIALILTMLCSCATAPAAPSVSPEPSPAPELTGNVFLDAEERYRPTGVEAHPLHVFITVPKEDALSASAEEYSAFLSERVESAKKLTITQVTPSYLVMEPELYTMAVTLSTLNMARPTRKEAKF